MNARIGARFKIIFLLPLSILAGCGGAKNDSQTFALKIIDQAIPGSALRLFLEPPLSTQISSPSSVPTSRASFECYGVNLTGPGIVSDASLIDCEVGTDNFQGRGAGLLSDLATDGEPIFIDNVPTGTGRRADIYGFYPTPPECGGSLANGTVIGAYYLGGLSFNFDSDATITIPTSFTAGSAHSIACTEQSNNYLIASDYFLDLGTDSVPSVCDLTLTSVTITYDGTSDIVVTARSANNSFTTPGGGTCSAPPFTLTPGSSCIERFGYSNGSISGQFVYGEGTVTYTYEGSTHALHIDLFGHCDY